MGKKKAVRKKKTVRAFQLGEYVRVFYSAFPYARIVELRGPLGPGGAMVYRVRIFGTQEPMYVELLGDEMEPLPADRLAVLKEQVAAREARDRAIAALTEDE